MRIVSHASDHRHHDTPQLNHRIQAYANQLECAARGANRMAQVALALLTRLQAPCGHAMWLPCLVLRSGRHVLIPWQCVTCGQAWLLDIRALGNARRDLLIACQGSAASVAAAYAALPQHEHVTGSGLHFKPASDDDLGANRTAGA